MVKSKTTTATAASEPKTQPRLASTHIFGGGVTASADETRLPWASPVFAAAAAAAAVTLAKSALDMFLLKFPTQFIYPVTHDNVSVCALNSLSALRIGKGS